MSGRILEPTTSIAGSGCSIIDHDTDSDDIEGAFTALAIEDEDELKQSVDIEVMDTCAFCGCFSDEPHDKDCPRLVSILGFNPPYSRFKSHHWSKNSAPTEKADLSLSSDPLRGIPPEIASNILLWAVEVQDPRDSVLESGHLPYDIFTRPLELAAVCRQWRELAFSEPRLWTTLDLRGSSASHWRHPPELLVQWLERSGQLPLTIFLMVPLYVDSGIDKRFETCIKTLCARRSRWESLLLNIPLCAIPLFQYDPDKTPLLSYLHLDTSRAPSESTPGPSVVSVLHPTHLVFVGERPLLLPLSWQNIVSLKLDGRNVPQLRDILWNCPKLENMHVSLQTWADENYLPVSNGPLALRHLKTMILEISDRQPLEDLLSQLTIPKLKKLSIQGIYVEVPVPVSVSSVTALYRRSECINLESLAFHNSVIVEEELLELLELASTLKYLTLNDNSPSEAVISDRFFRRLLDVSATNGTHTFLPRLCCIDYSGPTTFSWNLVADVAEARLNIPSKLDPQSHPRYLEYFALDTDNGFNDHEQAHYMDKESLLRLLKLAKGLDREGVYIHFSPRMMEQALVFHGLPAPEHDVGLYYSLPHCLAMYGLS